MITATLVLGIPVVQVFQRILIEAEKPDLVSDDSPKTFDYIQLLRRRSYSMVTPIRTTARQSAVKWKEIVPSGLKHSGDALLL